MTTMTMTPIIPLRSLKILGAPVSSMACMLTSALYGNWFSKRNFSIMDVWCSAQVRLANGFAFHSAVNCHVRGCTQATVITRLVASRTPLLLHAALSAITRLFDRWCNRTRLANMEEASFLMERCRGAHAHIMECRVCITMLDPTKGAMEGSGLSDLDRIPVLMMHGLLWSSTSQPQKF